MADPAVVAPGGGQGSGAPVEGEGEHPFFGADEGGDTPPSPEAVPPAVTPPTPETPPPAAVAPPTPAPETPPTGEPDGDRRPASELTWKNYRAREREAAELRQRVAQFEEMQRQQAERVAQALGVRQGPQEVPGQTRPYTQQELEALRQDDPLEYNRIVAEAAYNQQMMLAQRMSEWQQQQQIEQQITTFKATTPTYTAAMEYLQQKEEAALERLGLPRLDAPHQVDQRGTCCVQHALQVRAGMAISAAQQQGRNIAEVLYEVAKSYGWQEAPPPAAAPSNGNGARSPQQKVADSKAKTAAAMGAVGNIPSGPVTEGRDTPTPEELEVATDEDMDRWDREMPGWDLRVRGL